ncbi:GFA family protein [Rhizobium sp. TRM96647]|uniref:GFA family protein n=1 Tax=unclassified Rhizobium TaxID=2613769 RepID=UPI00399216D7
MAGSVLSGKQHLHLDRGERAVRNIRESGRQRKRIAFHFCMACGSTVFWKPDFKQGATAVAFGCFDEKEGLEPTQSVYDEQRHCWVSIHPV